MATHGYSVEITKPLHDRSRYYLDGEEPDQVVKPDFKGKVFVLDGLRLFPGGGGETSSVCAETLGFRHAAYRAKKQRLAVSPAPVAGPHTLPGTLTPWPVAASAAPLAAASRPPEPGGTLGWLTHRVLAALRGKR